MGYTTILSVFPNVSVNEEMELRNGWLTAPIIWNFLAKTYLEKSNFMMVSDNCKALWDLHSDKRLPEHQRNVLRLTFDRWYILEKDYKRAAGDIRAFIADIEKTGETTGHWPVIADFLEGNLELKPHFPAVGFHWTSVSENPFYEANNDDEEDSPTVDWEAATQLYGEDE